MSVECSLALDKETDRKLRWSVDVDGVPFKLYIPKNIVGDDVPQSILVTVESGDAIGLQGFQALEPNRIQSLTEFVAEHTETVRYQPVGDSRSWIIGEPYIPKTLLHKPWPKRLGLIIHW